jgi:hypothetical protein
MRVLKTIPSLAAGFALLISTTPVQAQTLAPSATYPNVNRPIAIAPGDTVQLLNQFIFDRGPALRQSGKRLDFQYSTRIPAANGGAREEQADRAAQFFGPQAVNMGARRIAIGICDTRECAENRHPPGAWFQYERAFDGTWRRIR